MKLGKKKHDMIFTFVILLLTISVAIFPGFLTSPQNKAKALKVEIISVDNTNLEQYGITKIGQQAIEAVVKTGKYKNQKVNGVNRLVGKMELDTVYTEGMTAMGTPFFDEEGKLENISLVGYWRISWEVILLGLFSLFLILFAGITGTKALVTFLFSGVMIWKIMLPLFLMGKNPVLISMGIVIILSAVILFMIGGVSERGVASFLGTASGLIVTWVLAQCFTSFFKISGAVKPFTEILLYSGYSFLDLTQIFISGIFLAASGAIMDISMDVATSIEEVHRHNPNLNRFELVQSGFRVGQSVIGTMTTTLLLAYSSNYLGLLMVFMAQGTPMLQILNLSYVSAEILNTIVGSFGLVLTAPLTAVISAILYTRS